MRSSVYVARQEKVFGTATWLFHAGCSKGLRSCVRLSWCPSLLLIYFIVLQFVDFYDLTDLCRPGEWNTWCKSCSCWLCFERVLSGYPASMLWQRIPNFHVYQALQISVILGNVYRYLRSSLQLPCGDNGYPASKLWQCCHNQSNNHDRKSSFRGVMTAMTYTVSAYDSAAAHALSYAQGSLSGKRHLQLPRINTQASQTAAFWCPDSHSTLCKSHASLCGPTAM